uniref:Uncharacterized protein n=1 Tax=Cacopsylla melanoneura TaxID=428564 RepID=A0A8D8VPS6_9HEMI
MRKIKTKKLKNVKIKNVILFLKPVFPFYLILFNRSVVRFQRFERVKFSSGVVGIWGLLSLKGDAMTFVVQNYVGLSRYGTKAGSHKRQSAISILQLLSILLLSILLIHTDK